MPRRVLIGFGVDVDAVAGWLVSFITNLRINLIPKCPRLGSYGGEDSPLDISRVSQGLYRCPRRSYTDD